jgi:two-component system sensor histidine kinase VicK
MSYNPPVAATLRALETAPNIYLVLSPELYIITASDLYLEATGTTREAISGKHIFEAFPDNPELPDADGVQNINASLQEVLLTKRPHYMRIQRYDVPDANRPGEFMQRYWDPSHSPVLDQDGNIHYIIQLANNVTEKVLADEAHARQLLAHKKLELSEKHFRQLAHIVPAKISTALPTGEVTFFNQQWLDYSGMNFEDLRDFGYYQMMHPEEIPVFREQLAEAAAKGIALESELRFKDINGDYRWHLNIASPVLNEKGEITMWVGSTTDIQRIKEEDQRKGELQQLINMLPASVVVIRGDELVVEMTNQSNLEYWGKKAEEAVGRKLLDILPELAGQPFAGQLRQVMVTGETVNVKESPVLFGNEDGSTRETFVDYTYQALTDTNGERNGVLVMSFEITDRVASRKLLEKYTEELQTVNDRLTDSNRELALSEERFKYLIQEAPVAIGVLSGRDLLITSANAKLLEVWGKTAVINGLPLARALPEIDGQPFLQILDDVYTSGQAFYANEIRALLEHDGELQEYFFNLVYQPIQIDPGLTTDILVVAVDVTEQVNARKRIEQAEMTLRLAVDAANVGTWTINAETREMTGSPRLNELFGFTAGDELTISSYINQITEEHRGRVAAAVEQVIAEGGNFDVSYTIEGFRDKKIRWLRAVGNLNPENPNGRAAFTGVIMDISEIKLEELRKNDFIGMVSHELKTPLTSLNALLQVAQQKLRNSGDHFLSGAMDKSNVQVKRMTSMINGFLNISRLESGQLHIEKRKFEIEGLIKDLLSEAQLTASTHILHFNKCEPITINADRDKIGSVISNFISNAIKYSPKGKNIEVDCKAIDGQVTVSVKDQGMGIKPEHLKKIFERYYRVETSHTQHISGFGIGLYLSSEIIARHGGRVWAESESGTGSTFYFSLPVK